MKLGVMANCFGDKSWEDACKAASDAGLKAIEPGAGGFVGKAHCNPADLLKDENQGKIISVLKFASASSAITSTRRGVIPAIPTRAEIEEFMSKL